MKKIAWLFSMTMLLALPAAGINFPPDRTLHIGHRGARYLSDENTLESLKLAVELGVDVLEFDVQRTRDGVFVIMHDETVDRTTNGAGRIAEMTLEQFKQLRTDRDYTPPSFEEVLTWLETNQVNFILDFKITDPAAVKDLIAEVEKHGLLDRVVFESPDPQVAAMVEKINPDLTTAIYPTDMFLMRYYLRKYNLDVASYYFPFANPLEVALVRSQGKKVVVWTVDSKGLIRWFTRIHVNGIMSDDPNLFK